ncbi:hypothetical protein DRE_04854 [Drechslerella stenobrocha 248]|uniref:Uncharacterized protein n=1 Tax=Drechslerella stenobrocha 248 TaxID=1043628 RepID=W7I043_9PEZI|nr:hypothetical protein DRE_04854 [Drechslerella stenobrocha 248]
MEPITSTSNLGRLSERRGIHKLAHIEPPTIVNSVLRPFQAHKSTLSHVIDGEPTLSTSNSSSSLASSISKASISAPRLQSTSSSVATTPLDPLLCMNFEASPSLPMTPEIGEFQGNWRQLDDEVVATYTGLGLDCEILEDLRRKTRSKSLSERVHVFVRTSAATTAAIAEQAEAEGPNLLPEATDMVSVSIPVPPTSFPDLVSTKPSVPTSTPPLVNEELYDPDTLSEPSAPTSPVPDNLGRTSRRTTVLQRMLPPKFRASMRRRSSSAHSAHAPPPIPPISTMPALYRQAPETPDEDFDSYFAEKLPLPDNDSFSSIEEMAHTCAQTPPLPPLMMPDYFTRTIPLRSTMCSTTTSPISGPPPMSEDFPDILPSPNCDSVKSPLPQPPISPLGSPQLPPVRTPVVNNLNPISLTGYQHQRIVPDVVDADSPAILSPKHRRKLSGEGPITANSLADMIVRMIKEDEAYEVTEKHLLESGWNTPQEVEAIREQRAETKAEWQQRIDDSKRILMEIRKQEVHAFARTDLAPKGAQ